MRAVPLLVIVLTLASSLTCQTPNSQVVNVIDIAPVWAGHPVGFALMTHSDRQYVAFYDAARQMTVASRTLPSTTWTFKVLPTSVGWDSHNYITMTLDDAGHLHISGNMHVNKLVYFRTTTPLDASTLEPVASMVGSNEDKCTYPEFLRGPANELIFTYRDGSSGNGNQIYNVYDLASRTWSRLLDRPLIDGEGLMNAYLVGPKRGPDGYFHLAWVWRDTPDCATNHDLSYARSKDLRHWEKSTGQSLALPITIKMTDIIDPVPARGGMINGNVAIGFDNDKRPIVSYHKFDATGMTQVYNARLENGRWQLYQTSDWSYRWEFSGGGSIVFDIRVSSVVAMSNGTLTQSFQNAKHGSGVWILDAKTLKPVTLHARLTDLLRDVDKPESDFPGMQVKWQGSGRYRLRWETLLTNRDQPHPQPWPAPSMLRLYEMKG